MPETLVSRSSGSKAPEVRGRRRRNSNVIREFDIRSDAHHHDSVKSTGRTFLLFAAAMLLAWHGVVLSTPHTHADTAISQEELACLASRPLSQTNHLHGSGHSVTHHLCLACLAGTAVADAMRLAEVEEAAVGKSTRMTASSDLRSRLYIQLPFLRGPPATS